MTTSSPSRRLHHDLDNVGLRAQATAVGLVQLCIELQRAKVLDGAAVERIKNSIADEVCMSAPRSVGVPDYRRDMKARLDRLFKGEEDVGPADAMDQFRGPTGE